MKLQFGKLIITDKVENRLEELGFTPETLESAVSLHKSNCNGSPSLYCGTYAKYNEGSICGLWIDVDSFDDYDEFIDFCKAIHADEDDPELMFQDYDAFPGEWYSESGLGEKSFENIKEYCRLSNLYSTEAVDAFICGVGEDLSRFEECYMGEYDSEEDYAQQLVEDCYDIDKIMGKLSCYFDYAAFARDLFMCDYFFDNNFVFCRCC